VLYFGHLPGEAPKTIQNNSGLAQRLPGPPSGGWVSGGGMFGLRRRDFITLLGGAGAAWPLAARAQQPSARQIGVLSPLSPSAAASPPFETFRKTLLDLGHVEGRSIGLEYRWADGDPARLAAFAAELVDLKVDVIFCGPGTPTAIAAKKATARIPIVFVGAGDAVGAGLVATLARPGGNATGLVNQSQDIAGKQMEILKEAVPTLSRMGVLWRPSNPSYRNLVRRFDDVVRATGVEVVLISAENVADLVAAFETMKKGSDQRPARPGRRLVHRRGQTNRGIGRRLQNPGDLPARRTSGGGRLHGIWTEHPVHVSSRCAFG